MEAQATVASRKGKEFLLSECYVSVQGESSLVGTPTIFVRLYTCNLRCRWCDSMHAVEGGDFTRTGVDATVKKILGLDRVHRVTPTAAQVARVQSHEDRRG